MLGTKVSESKFKKNTDGRPKKLHFDFNNNDNSLRKIPNKIIIQEKGENKPEILIHPFRPIKSLTAQLNNDNTITFTPAVKPLVQSTDTVVDDRKKTPVTIQVPKSSGEWKIMSGGEALNIADFKASTPPTDTDTVSVSADGKPNKLLSVFATTPSKIVAQKGAYGAEITTFKASDLETLAQTKTITIKEDGKATTKLSKPETSITQPIPPVQPAKTPDLSPSNIKPQPSPQALELKKMLLNGGQGELPTRIESTPYYINTMKENVGSAAPEVTAQLDTIRELQPLYANFRNDDSKAAELLEKLKKTKTDRDSAYFFNKWD